MKPKFFLVFAGGLVLAWTTLVWAGAFDSIATGARANGMGAAYTAVADDPTSIYWNPAGLLSVKRSTITISRQDLASLGLLEYDQFIYSQPFVYKNAVAFAWYRLATTGQVTFLNYRENTFVLSFAQSLLDELSVGMNFKVLQVDYSNSAGGYGLDMGLRCQPWKEIAVGVMAENFNFPELYWYSGTYERLPLNLRAGVAVYFNSNILVAVDADQLLEEKPELHLGGEYQLFGQTLNLRAGVVYLPKQEKFEPSAGLGIRIAFLDFHYAFAAHYDLDAQHVFTVNWNF